MVKTSKTMLNSSGRAVFLKHSFVASADNCVACGSHCTMCSSGIWPTEGLNSSQIWTRPKLHLTINPRPFRTVFPRSYGVTSEGSIYWSKLLLEGTQVTAVWFQQLREALWHHEQEEREVGGPRGQLTVTSCFKTLSKSRNLDTSKPAMVIIQKDVKN